MHFIESLDCRNKLPIDLSPKRGIEFTPCVMLYDRIEGKRRHSNLHEGCQEPDILLTVADSETRQNTTATEDAFITRRLRNAFSVLRASMPRRIAVSKTHTIVQEPENLRHSVDSDAAAGAGAFRSDAHFHIRVFLAGAVVKREVGASTLCHRKPGADNEPATRVNWNQKVLREMTILGSESKQRY